MQIDNEAYVAHYGKKGMKWGVRKEFKKTGYSKKEYGKNYLKGGVVLAETRRRKSPEGKAFKAEKVAKWRANASLSTESMANKPGGWGNGGVKSSKSVSGMRTEKLLKKHGRKTMVVASTVGSMALTNALIKTLARNY